MLYIKQDQNMNSAGQKCVALSLCVRPADAPISVLGSKPVSSQDCSHSSKTPQTKQLKHIDSLRVLQAGSLKSKHPASSEVPREDAFLAFSWLPVFPGSPQPPLACSFVIPVSTAVATWPFCLRLPVLWGCWLI